MKKYNIKRDSMEESELKKFINFIFISEILELILTKDL